MLESAFNSDCHGLQLSAEKRGAHFAGKAYYTFSRALEDLDFQGGALPAIQNASRIELERARKSADRTQVFVASGVWRIDYVKDPGLPSALLNDWTLSAIVTLQSGQPMTITSGLDRNLDGLTTDRPNVTGDPTLDSSRPRDELIERWFDVAAFTQPAIGADGTPAATSSRVRASGTSTWASSATSASAAT